MPASDITIGRCEDIIVACLTHSFSDDVIRKRRDHLVSLVSHEQSLAEHCPANSGQLQVRNEMENHIGFKDGRVALFDALKAALAPIGRIADTDRIPRSMAECIREPRPANEVTRSEINLARGRSRLQGFTRSK